MPNLLVAPVSPTSEPSKDSLYEDYPHGYYADGAYTAIPAPHPPNFKGGHQELEEDEDLDPQDAYYASLLSRFSALSTTLQSPNPTPPAPDSTPKPHLRSNSSVKYWRKALLQTTPTMHQLSQMWQEAVIRGLEILEDLITSGNLKGAKGRNLGAWAWGLLGRCREVGCMGSEEVGVLRRVGKRAVYVLRRIAAGGFVVGDEIGGDGGDGGDDVANEHHHHANEETEESEKVLPGAQEGEADENEAATLELDLEEGEETNDAILPIQPSHIMDEDTKDTTEADLLSAATSHVSNTIDPSHPAQSLNPESQMSEESALAAARARALSSLQNTDEIEDPGEAIDLIGGENPQLAADPDIKGASAPNTTPNGGMDTVHATLDMIVTIVGEYYGQRDLLDGRLLWDELS